MISFRVNTMKITYEFPSIYAINERLEGNIIQQIICTSHSLEVYVEKYEQHRVKGYTLTPLEEDQDVILAIENSAKPPKDFSKVIKVRKLQFVDNQVISVDDSKAKWLIHPDLSKIPDPPIQYQKIAHEVTASWESAFNYFEENISKGTPGLRPAQMGAILTVRAHWITSDRPATIVMPTGIGKTETMLSVMVCMQCQNLLVVVPTDALRTQIANKFLTFGILKDLKVVSEGAKYPIVGILKHRPQNMEKVKAFFTKCNVIVSTMSIAGQCSEEIQKAMAEHSQYLFIDEAHHLGAKTWKGFKGQFSSSRILQFTATPFREDGKPVEGKPIFNYPLKKAQEEGYFRPIRFEPVVEWNPDLHDKAIAEKAVEQLRSDYEKGHILMARVGRVDRAEEVLKIYKQYKEFNPVQIHSGINLTERNQFRNQIINGDARIVVCVDMLGEGFDLPELKIAAFHDIRKTLPVTLQLAGRFTRGRTDLGDPTFIANVADIEVKEEIRKLYAQDADWNILLRQASTEAIQEEFDLWEFIEGFKDFPKELSLQNVKPAMSTVVYRTKCENWNPAKFNEGIKGYDNLDRTFHDLNPLENTLVIVTTKKLPVEWAQIEEIYTWAWELFILYWDQPQNLLFIHGSSNSGFYKDLAIAVAGDDVEQIKGPPVFRCFYNINRLRLQNVGLLEQLGRLIRYTMRAGSDVEPGLSEAQKTTTVKSNLFGGGFEGGSKTTIGSSYKGRIWSRRTTNIRAFTVWCTAVGKKLLDESIDPDDVLKGTLVPVMVAERPMKMPIAIEWPDLIYRESETIFKFIIDTNVVLPLYLADITLVSPSEDGDIRFAIRSGDKEFEFSTNLSIKNNIHDFTISKQASEEVNIKYGTYQAPLTEFLYEHPPVIWFYDGSSLEGNSYIELKKSYDPYPKDNIKTWDWTGIDIKKESQGVSKTENSIQHRVIRELMESDYEVIFDDDGTGEAADVVAIEIQEEVIKIEFFHCKYSGGTSPGHRLEDLYELCGQAQKSINWKVKPTELFSHLLRREPLTEKGVSATRFEKGTKDDLYKLRQMSRSIRCDLTINIVQPGLSKGEVSVAQLELLSVTENYLMETYKIDFVVIASP